MCTYYYPEHPVHSGRWGVAEHVGGTHLSVNSAGSDWPEAQHTQRVGRNAMRCDVPARCQPRFGTRKRVPYVNALCRRWAAQSFHSELLWIPGVVAGVQEGATLPHHPFYACSSYCMDLTVWTYARTDLAAQTCNCSQARHFRYTFPEVGGLALSCRRNRVRGDYRRRGRCYAAGGGGSRGACIAGLESCPNLFFDS